MQSVVRSSFIGLLAIAGLTACGDKVTQVQGDNVVHSVTVTPNSVPNLPVGGSVTLAASVDAGSGVTDRTVTWSSSDATIASVDATTGKVTGVKAGGPVTITAASKADANVKGAAVVTVVTGSGSAVPLVSISTINQTVCGLAGCNSVPATLTNVAGQVDVTLNVDANGAALSKVTGMIKCGNDSVQVVQNYAAGANVAELGADAATSPTTLSFNTAAFTPAGVVALHNGQCTVSAFATTTGGTQSAINSTSFTLNNQDMAVVTVTSTSQATDPANRPWIGGGPLTITALPIMYSGRTPVAATVGFNLGTPLPNTTAPSTTSQTLTALSAGAFTATWSNGPTAPSVQNWASIGVTPNVTISDASGATTSLIGSVTVKGGTVTNTPANGTFNFDDQKPAPGTFSVTTNPDQNIVGGTGYIGANFRFVADSAAGYRGPSAGLTNPFVGGTYGATGNSDNGGVDKVTVTFQFRTAGSGTYTTVTNTSTINESTSFNSYQLRMLTIDALGNADTTGTNSVQSTLLFGVDKTAPTVTVAGGPADKFTTTNNAALGTYVFNISDALSGQGAALVAQVRQWNGLTSANSLGGLANNEGWVATNVAAPVGVTKWGAVGSFNSAAGATNTACLIGRFNVAQSAAGPGALPVLSASGTTLGYCTPVVYTLAGNSNLPAAAVNADGYWYTTVIAADVAGNQTSATTRVVLADGSIPVIANIDPPATITGNATASFPARAQDSLSTSVGDIVASWATVNYTGAGVSLRYPTTAGPGVAFDNVLTTAATVTPQIPNFIKNLQTNTGSSAVTSPTAANNAISVLVAAQDAAGNVSSGTTPYTLAPATQLVAGSTADIRQNTTANGTIFNGGFLLSKTDAAVSNCASCSPSQNTSTVLVATAVGQSGLFNNPFVGGAVSIWYRVNGSTGPYFFGGNAGSGSSRDNLTFRAWDYSLTFDPPTTAPDGTDLTVNGTVLQIIAIGVNTAGDAVMTPPITLNIVNP